MSKKLDDIFNIEYSNVEYSDYDPSERISGGWNDCPEFKKAVSEGMTEMWNTDAGVCLRKTKSLIQRKMPEKYISFGHKNLIHDEEIRKKISESRRGKKFSEKDKNYIKENYVNGMGIKTIAKNLGFSATAVRKHIKVRNIK